MDDPEGPLAGDPREPAHPGGDRDIAAGSILGFSAGLAVFLVISAAVCALIFGLFRSSLERRDPPPSPVAEANAPVIPPEPRLQESPIRDMDVFRQRELEVLDGYGWVDRDAGVARIPIDRAIDLYVERGLRPAVLDADGGAP